jgi:hypothetical protein
MLIYSPQALQSSLSLSCALIPGSRLSRSNSDLLFVFRREYNLPGSLLRYCPASVSINLTVEQRGCMPSGDLQRQAQRQTRNPGEQKAIHRSGQNALSGNCGGNSTLGLESNLPDPYQLA